MTTTSSTLEGSALLHFSQASIAHKKKHCCL